MLVGIHISKYKAFKSSSYIQLAEENNDLFCSLLGHNGTGKSTILEGIDALFNLDGLKRNINNQAGSLGGIAKNPPSITGVFIISKAKFSDLDGAMISLLEKIDSIHRQNNYSRVNAHKEIKDHITILSDLYPSDEYFLFLIGKTHPYYKKHKKLEPFIPGICRYSGENQDGMLFNIEESVDITETQCHKVADLILAKYKYIYIPTELSLNDFSRFESEEFSKIIGDELNSVVGVAYDNANFDQVNDQVGKYFDLINGRLGEFVFKEAEKERQSRISKTDFIEIIFNNYFRKRTLHKKAGTKEISAEYLSSGEKRLGILNIIEIFLTSKITSDHFIVLGVDEPELSLHISKCFQFFEKLYNLTSHQYQVLVTTHRYGFLPYIGKGITHIISKNNDDDIAIESYNLARYPSIIRDTKAASSGKFPLDVNFKSYVDLAQTIFNNIRSDGSSYHRLLCEGYSDKIYLDHFLNDPQIKVLALGGCDFVIKVHNILSQFISKDEGGYNKKVFSLMDVDKQKGKTPIDSENTSYLQLKYILLKEDKVDLIPKRSNIEEKTDIEGILYSKYFKDTLLELNAFDSLGLEELIDKIESDLTYSGSTIESKLTGEEKLQISGLFTSEFKVEFAKTYIKYHKINEKPDRVTKIESFFQDN